MLDSEASGLRVFGVVIWSVRNDDLVVGNTSVAEVLCLCGTLVPETIFLLIPRHSENDIIYNVHKENDRLVLKDIQISIGIVVAVEGR